MSQWITEEQTPHLRLSAEAEEVLYSGESEFQKIEVFKSKEYGMMLALDGVFQTSEREEFIYHMIENHPKLTVKIGDGIGFMAEAEDYYDVIIVDCSDPIGPGEGLFTEEFYKNTLKALKADGLFVQQTESPMLHQPLVEKVFGYVNNHFPIARLYTAFIPLYPAGMHCFTLGSKTFDPLKWTPNREQTFETKYYNEGIQKAAFALPNFVKNYLPSK